LTQPFLPLEWPDPAGALAQLRERLTTIRAANAARYQQLATPGADGRRAIPDPLGVLALRFNTALDFLFLDEDTRVGFDLAFEEKMTEVLDQCTSQRRQQELLAPLRQTPTPSLLLPGQQP
jgi:hypothetical protein